MGVARVCAQEERVTWVALPPDRRLMANGLVGDAPDRVTQDLHRRLGQVLIVVRRARLPKVLQLPAWRIGVSSGFSDCGNAQGNQASNLACLVTLPQPSIICNRPITQPF